MLLILLKELVSYNPVTGEWATLSSMLVPRSQANKPNNQIFPHYKTLYILGFPLFIKYWKNTSTEKLPGVFLG